MANRPTVGGSDGSWGTELNDHLDVSLDTDGKVDDGAAQTTSAAPGADAEIANKKYVDDQITANAVDTDANAKAWCRVNAAGTLQGSGYNITSTSRSSEGRYVITWDTDFANVNYAVQITIKPSDSPPAFLGTIVSMAVGSVTIDTLNLGGDSFDADFTITAFGTQ